MLDPKTKELWIEALESGKYLQGTNRLKKTVTLADKTTVTSHCCLGVLCEVLNLPSEEYFENQDKIVTKFIFEDELSSTGFLKGKLAKDIGPNNLYNLSEINDESDNFNEVISYIKNNL